MVSLLPLKMKDQEKRRGKAKIRFAIERRVSEIARNIVHQKPPGMMVGRAKSARERVGYLKTG